MLCSYYERQKEAVENPDTIMSIITDGMAQNHCVLPWLAGLKEFPNPLPQHLLGVLEHGHELVRCLQLS